MQSTHEAELDFPSLPKEARLVHIVPALAQYSLLSIGQLCDNGCKVIFDYKEVNIIHRGKTVLQGYRDHKTRLWHVEIPSENDANEQYNVAHAAIGSTKKEDIVAFAHAALFSPAITTLEKALDKGFIRGFPGLDTKSLRKHPPQSFAMVKGHLDQSRKNQRSTKTKVTIVEPDDEIPEQLDERTHHCFVAVQEMVGQIYTDQTGRFIAPSHTGNNYIMVLYDYDSNAILVKPMKNRKPPRS